MGDEELPLPLLNPKSLPSLALYHAFTMSNDHRHIICIGILYSYGNDGRVCLQKPIILLTFFIAFMLCTNGKCAEVNNYLITFFIDRLYCRYTPKFIKARPQVSPRSPKVISQHNDASPRLSISTATHVPENQELHKTHRYILVHQCTAYLYNTTL